MTKGQRTTAALLAVVAVLLAADTPADDLLVNCEALFVRSARDQLGVSVIGSPQGGKLTVFDSIGQPTFSITGNKIESSALERFVGKIVADELAKLTANWRVGVAAATPTPAPRSTGSKTLRYTQDDLLVGPPYFEITVGNVRRVTDYKSGQDRGVVWEVLLLVRNTGPFDCWSATLTSTGDGATIDGAGAFSRLYKQSIGVTRLKRDEVARYVIYFVAPDQQPSGWLEFSLARQDFEQWK